LQGITIGVITAEDIFGETGSKASLSIKPQTVRLIHLLLPAHIEKRHVINLDLIHIGVQTALGKVR
jgi:hypothetical protein